MSAQQIVRHLRAIADQGAPGGQHGLAYITVWQARRAADEIEHLAARVAELEATYEPTQPEPTLFG